MKQLALVFIAIAVSMVAFAQDTTKKAVSAGDLTAREVYTDFKNFVASLEGPAKHTYTIMVRKAKVDGIVDLSIELFFIILSTILFAIGYRMGKKDDSDSELPGVIIIASVVSMFFSLLFFGMDLSGNINRIVNPEYYAIKTLLEALK